MAYKTATWRKEMTIKLDYNNMMADFVGEKEGFTSKEFCKYVLDKTGVVLTPGIAFGVNSDGYFRLSLVQSD